MVKKKRQSKRQTLKDKYKIQKKVTQHHRQQRREARKAARNGTGPKPKKDPGLPNLMPFKEQFLRKALEENEREKEHERERIKRLHELRRERAEEAMEDSYEEGAAETDKKRKRGALVGDLADAANRAEEFERRQAEAEAEAEEIASNPNELAKGKKRMYMKDLRNVVEASDVVLLVLDARDPIGCRAPQAEKMVLENARNKRLIFVLNKIDLVPKRVVERWLTVLRREFPTVAFRASTQHQRSNLGRASKDSIGLGASSTALGGSTIGDSLCVGADTLLQLLKNYSRNRNIKTSITVGVVGYPNVGKSSVINSLKRSRAVGVSPTAGFTKTLQHVQLDKKVKLIDSPGVLFQDSAKSDRLVLRNCFNPMDLEDAVGPVSRLLAKCNPEMLMGLYTLTRFGSPTELLVQLATSRGKLNKGGVPDLNAAARIILQDWNSGKIPFYVSPPKDEESATPRVTSTVVTTWAKEFDIDALMAKEDSEMVERLPEDMDEDDFAVIFDGAISL